MAKKKRMPKSLRKFIRKEKARIRRGILDIKEQERLISELYERIHPIKSDKVGVKQPNKVKQDDN